MVGWWPFRIRSGPCHKGGEGVEPRESRRHRVPLLLPRNMHYHALHIVGISVHSLYVAPAVRPVVRLVTAASALVATVAQVDSGMTAQIGESGEEPVTAQASQPIVVYDGQNLTFNSRRDALVWGTRQGTVCVDFIG